MRYLAVALDYDGTIAEGGKVADATLDALKRIQASGRRLLLVTGRQVKDLRRVFPEYEIFELVVAENGAVLYRPKGKHKEVLAEPPSAAFLEALHSAGIEFDTGHVVISTARENESALLQAISELGLEMQVIFNKDVAMVLPSGVNKASGLTRALAELELSPHDVLAAGDAENDHAFLALAECSVAVGNALPSLKERADLVTEGADGQGIAELTDRLLDNELADVAAPLQRNSSLLGYEGEREVTLPPRGVNLLVTGTSGSGKSTAVTGFLERLAERGYQLCIIDPEGDYEGFEPAIVLGDTKRAPSADEVLEVLRSPDRHVVANLLGVSLGDRPRYFARLLPRLLELRATRGRPHWIVVDEAHHLMPADWEIASEISPPAEGMVYVTVHPDLMYKGALEQVNTMLVTGKQPAEAVRAFAQAVGETAKLEAPEELEHRHALLWHRGQPGAIEFTVEEGKLDLKRHGRKYAEGNLGPDRSFYFRGPNGDLKLQAQNLMLFSQIGEGVDDKTWTYHLRRHDYSQWFNDAIKDKKLAKAVRKIEDKKGIGPKKSRSLIRAAIEERFTLPADEPSGLQDENS
ncbi:MAG: HAD-IIB family hydrolase [Dehalococcoidia bacterium]